jgi:hypothetical protein
VAYVRRKTIRGRDYLYWVEGRLVDGKVRQKVLRYLGPAGDPSVRRLAETLSPGGAWKKPKAPR